MPLRNQQEAENTVFDNLEMSAEELGIGDNDLDMDLDDDGSIEGQQQNQQSYDDDDSQGELDYGEQRQEEQQNNQRQEQQQQQEPELRSLRVSHTEQQRQPRGNANEQATIAALAQQGIKPDQKGNLIDQNGRIVAKAGSERRMYVNMSAANQRAESIQRDAANRLQRASAIAQELARRHNETQQKLQQLEAVPQQLQLSNSEVMEAMQMFAQGKRDPVGLLKSLLTRAATNGIDLTQLGLERGAFDPQSFMQQVQSTISQAVQPVVQNQTQQQQAQQRQSEERQRVENAQQQVRTYFEQNPDMVPYAQVFQEAVNDPRLRGMSLTEIGLRIRNNLLQNQMQQRSQQNPPSRSRPNGQGSSQHQRPQQVASADASWDDIIRGVLNDSNV